MRGHQTGVSPPKQNPPQPPEKQDLQGTVELKVRVGVEDIHAAEALTWGPL